MLYKFEFELWDGGPSTIRSGAGFLATPASSAKTTLIFWVPWRPVTSNSGVWRQLNGQMTNLTFSNSPVKITDRIIRQEEIYSKLYFGSVALVHLLDVKIVDNILVKEHKPYYIPLSKTVLIAVSLCLNYPNLLLPVRTSYWSLSRQW